jgi:hypothetical protein
VAKEKYRGILNSHLYSHSSHGRQELCTGVATEHGKQPCNRNRKDTNEELVRSKVEMYKAVADEAVVVMISAERQKERRASHNRF